MAEPTIYQHLTERGVNRRDFLRLCGGLVGAMGLHDAAPLLSDALGRHPRGASALVLQVAHALQDAQRLPVVWLEFQDCAGCTMALTRSKEPTMVDLVLNELTIGYHETLSAAAGHAAEAVKTEFIERHRGRYLLVVEGSVPTGADGAYCTVGGRSAVDLMAEAVDGAAAVVATGNCAAFGGIPKAAPNPTGARGIGDLVAGKPLVNIPGCPAVPEVTAGTIVHYIVFGTLPELDELKRPTTFYGQTIHQRCPRRPHFNAGRFAQSFDDAGARQGWCLLELGCRGPSTANACPTRKWGGGLSFPVESGHPCLGCSEPNFWDWGDLYPRSDRTFRRYVPQALKAGG